MPGTMLVPLDGSEFAERALPFAKALARRRGKQLVLVRAVPTYEFAYRADSKDGAVAKLDTLVAALRQEGIEATAAVTPVVLSSGVPDAILDLARVHHAELIVMSTHGRGGLGRWMFGSVADAVLRRAEVPVVLVPAGSAAEWSQRELRALVPLDGSPLAESALGLAESLADTIVLARVVETLNYASAEVYAAVDWDAELVEAQRYLEGVQAMLTSKGRTVETADAMIGPVASTIAELADDRGADMIVMATHGRGGLSRAVLGSAASGVLRWAHVPVLLLRPEVARQQQAATTSEPVHVTIGVSREELDTLERALGHLTFAEHADQALAERARDLLRRLRGLESEVRVAGAESAEVMLNH